MEEIKDRLRKVRKTLGMNQSDFAASVGLQQATCSSYENGTRPISDIVILTVCAKYNVNEQWLRTGEGNMFRELSEDEELAGLFGDLLSKDPPKTAKLKKRLIIKLLKLDDQQFEAAIRFARDVLGKDDE